METIWQMIGTVICAILASSGFWAYMVARRDKKNKDSEKNDAKTDMIMGLGHDRIIYLCGKYIDRGWIGTDEYENLREWLYEPYEAMGGNGTAKRLMAIVENLPTKEIEYTSDGKRIESEARPQKRK